MSKIDEIREQLGLTDETDFTPDDFEAVMTLLDRWAEYPEITALNVRITQTVFDTVATALFPKSVAEQK